MAEALRGGGAVPAFAHTELRSAPAANGLINVLRMQTVGATKYFDAAGFPGRTVGPLAAPSGRSEVLNRNKYSLKLVFSGNFLQATDVVLGKMIS
jgi:hypothetical protein